VAKKRKPKHQLPEGAKVLVRNRRATYDYQVHERIEAGVVLQGSEVKSLRESSASLSEGYAEIRNGEAWLVGVQINEYPWANRTNHEVTRTRKLLMHKREIDKLGVKTQQRGYTLIPTCIYLKNGKIKVELALASGKRQFEKRQAAREADDRREMSRASSD
jgi:SsrA-binding protein